MNKEYCYLSNKELLVIDDKGQPIKRNIESTDMHDMLLLENDLEKINNKIIELENIIYKYEKNKVTKMEKITLLSLPFFIAMDEWSMGRLFNPFIYENKIPAIIGIVLGTVVLDTAVILSTKERAKHINGTKSELFTAKQLKDDLEKKLSNIKDKSKDSIELNINALQKEDKKINDVVNLEESTPFYEDAIDKMNNSYKTGYGQKVKRLTLKK